MESEQEHKRFNKLNHLRLVNMTSITTLTTSNYILNLRDEGKSTELEL